MVTLQILLYIIFTKSSPLHEKYLYKTQAKLVAFIAKNIKMTKLLYIVKS